MIFVTSDFHFGHNKDFVYAKRGFSSVEEMNEYLVDTANLFVGPDDDFYILGDLMLGGDENFEYVKKLNGKLHLVYGNHDTDRRIALYKTLPNLVEDGFALRLNYKKYHFYLSHFPTLTGNIDKETLHQMTLNLYGHTHQETFIYDELHPYMFHVGVDSAPSFQPWDLDQIILIMKQLYRKTSLVE